MRDKAIELAQQFGELEEQVKIELINAIAESSFTSKTHQALCLRVNVFGYTELAVINGNLTFLDANGYHYGIDTDAQISDLIDILMSVDSRKWICTDPDNDQYRLDEGQDVWKDTKFTFMEKDQELAIDLNNYPKAQIKSCLASYGYDLNEDDGFYYDAEDNKIDNSIIAECIFEQTI